MRRGKRKITPLRIALMLAFGVVAWRGYARFADNPLAVPTPDDGSRANREYFVGMAMGATVTITIDAEDPALAKAAARAALEELERLDRMLSDWKESSDLTAFHRSGAVEAEVAPDFARVLARGLEVARLTDGRFDPTVGPLVALWRASRTSGALPDAATLAAARARCGWSRVKVEDGRVHRGADDVLLDFGGIGKGFGAIAALETLRAKGCPRAIVAVAGDIAVGEPPRGEAGWKIDVESASKPERIVVARCAVSTSGATEQSVEIGGVRYAHIVDPRTGLGATDAARATVIGPLDAAVDALGTALALTKDDAEVDAILARFPEYGARIERVAQGESSANEEVVARVTYHGAWKR
ncbi:MAG: FAD:protein FMN transferase [Planctomycetaceae bacterium]|nr:FAD:protein FMN transferase [Planctomycetaceae bacterium]